MNRKQLIILIVVAAVLGVLGWMAYQKQAKPYEESTRRMGEKLIKDFPLNDVAQLTIKQSKSELNLAKRDDVWAVKERGDYPANFGSISDFLRKVWEMKVTQPVKVGPSRLPQLELVALDKGGTGTLVEFKDSKGKVINSLLLGAKHMKESPAGSQFGGGAWPDGRYVMVGTNLQSVAMVNDALSNIEPKPEDWLNKDWFKVEKLKSVSVVATNATNNWKLTRETETGEWKLADAKGDEKADSGKVSGMNYLLSSPSFNDLALSFKFDETNKPTTTARLETFENFNYSVKLAPKSGDDYHVQVAVAADIPKERTPGKDEKPEDKEKLDKEFKEKNQKLQDKLKAEKAYEKWSYVVSKWTVDNLLKERKDLLAEKKDESKKEESKSEAPKPAETKTAPPPPRSTNVVVSPVVAITNAVPATTNKPAPPPPPPLPPKPPEPKPSETKAVSPPAVNTNAPATVAPATNKVAPPALPPLPPKPAEKKESQ